MQTDIIRAELERLFELEELEALTRDILGFDPAEVGGTTAKGTFAGALIDYCVSHHAVEALADALYATRTDIDPRIAELRNAGLETSEPFERDDELGPFRIVRLVGEGPHGTVYLGRMDDTDYRIKVLSGQATSEPRRLQRFWTHSRLVSKVSHVGLPREVMSGQYSGQPFVAHRFVEGRTLDLGVQRTGPTRFEEAQRLLAKLLLALSALHKRRLCHGNLQLGNVLVHDAGEREPNVLLLDAGGQWLGGRPHAGLAPEQLDGRPPNPSSDVYCLGVLLFELLTGKHPFAGSPPERRLKHLVEAPPPPSQLAPRGWVPQAIDAFVASLLTKDPAQRPQNADAVLGLMGMLGRSAEAGQSVDEEVVTQHIEALLQAPDDQETARALESLVDRGAPPGRLAEAFKMAAELLDEAPQVDGIRLDFLFRAARLYEAAKETQSLAGKVYEEILELQPGDEIALAGLEEARRHSGEFEELVEMLLERHAQLKGDRERAEVMAEIGDTYSVELGDREQAIVAYAQACAENPGEPRFAAKLEDTIGRDEKAWKDTLDSLSRFLDDPGITDDQRIALLLKLAHWYQTALSRSDLALACLTRVTDTDPANDQALAGLIGIYRKTQEWKELGMALSRRAEIATPARSRDLRAEAAEILEKQLNDAGGARDIYERILKEDPSHPVAAANLGHLLERTGDHSAFARVLQRQREATRGQERVRISCRLGDLYDTALGDTDAAISAYKSALAEDHTHLDALRGLDRVLSKAGHFSDLLENLRAQLSLAATPRQKIVLHTRVARIFEEEFLDHEGASSALEEVLRIDPGHLETMSSLVAYSRVLKRWERASELYERQLSLVTDGPSRIELGLAWGRMLADQVGSPERATSAYEQVLQVDPEHAGALEALAKLRESTGDADRAVDAILALADKAASPEARAQQYLRAARLFESRGDRDRAIEHYKNALDADPTDRATAVALRKAYTERGDANAAWQLLSREIESTDGELARGKLAAEQAALAKDQLKDDERATRAAKRSLQFDPTNLEAHRVLGDIAFENQRFVEASQHYAPLADRADTMPTPLATKVLVRYVDALSQSGSTERALAPMDTLLRIAPNDGEALARVALVTFEHGSHERAVELHRDLLERFGSEMSPESRTTAHYRYGEALRRSGELQAALGPLEDAAKLDPGMEEPLVALAKTYEELAAWDLALAVMSRHLDLAIGDTKVELLVRMGDIASEKLGDLNEASKHYVTGLEERPNDRRLLTKLMQLYSEEKDWDRLVDVVVKLATFVDDPAQKAKYLQTAGMVTALELGNVDRALAFYGQALELDPSIRVIDEVLELERQRGDHAQVERLLRQKLDLAKEADDHRVMLSTFDQLGTLYEKDLGDMENAIDAYEAAHTLDPENHARAALLGELYSADPHKYLDKAVLALTQQLHTSPFRQESYRALRRLYTETANLDASWCLCQTMSVLNLAEPDEERHFVRLRAGGAAAPDRAMDNEDWLSWVLHPNADALLTSVLALIEPAVIELYARAPEDYGYGDEHGIDLENHYATISHSLDYAARVMGMASPPAYENVNDPGGLAFLHCPDPGIVLGNAALNAELPPEAAAFIAARHLTYLRPGLYLRQLVGTGTGLKSWLFAAIKLTSPTFPIAQELQGPVEEAQNALRTSLKRETRTHLSRVVSKMLQSGAALDLKRWIVGVDLTADRMGFVVGHDLDTAVQIIKASDDSTAAVPVETRFKELVLYSVSPEYLALREKLGIRVSG